MNDELNEKSVNDTRDEELKRCASCGAEILPHAAFCPYCGKSVNGEETEERAEPKWFEEPEQPVKDSNFKTAIKAFMLIGTVVYGLYIMPLLWCVPMTMSYFKKAKKREKTSLGFKICTLFFVNVIAGILMILDPEEQN